MHNIMGVSPVPVFRCVVLIVYWYTSLILKKFLSSALSLFLKLIKNKNLVSIMTIYHWKVVVGPSPGIACTSNT
jgi:hypothetical protein